ncbi:putative phosphoenolpyruvate carboxykinase (ATP) [Lupinus albus]|uniref:Putative phosphoenolpyruvate carboxykinase (ATP) n=1 Tax=Lupinus albus TaxID=3870 RepID=A0A6A4QKL4_LUPAL|nr:putative phosphoenolpyruvate carboxykinase (ATP) [Lupinus albus]
MATSSNITKENVVAKIDSQKNENKVCDDNNKNDNNAPTLKVQNIDELPSLQKKKSAPTTPNGLHVNSSTFNKQQLQSIRYIIIQLLSFNVGVQ